MQPFPTAPPTANANALAGWMVNANPSSSVQSSVVASSLPGPPNQGIFGYFEVKKSGSLAGAKNIWSRDQ